jgi:hypothetical protein
MQGMGMPLKRWLNCWILTTLVLTAMTTDAISQAGLKVERIGELLGANPLKIAIQGNYAYVAAEGFFLILNIADPANPQLISRMATRGEARDVKVEGNYAYLAAGLFGLRIIDISDPASPVERGAFEIKDKEVFVASVALRETYAYIVDRPQGLRILDVSDAANPKNIGTWVYDKGVSGGAVSIAVSGSYAYLAGLGFYVIDISNPVRPKTKSLSFEFESFYNAVAKGHLVYTDSCVIDVSDPKAVKKAGIFPKPAGASEIPRIITGLEPHGLDIVGSDAYLTSDSGGFRILDISDPSAPKEKGFCNTSGPPHDVAVTDKLAYVANSTGIEAIDISNPENPISKGILATPAGTAHDIALSGTSAYEAEDVGLRVIDIGDPMRPKSLGILRTPGSANNLTVQSGVAYMTSTQGLEIIDISNPAGLRQITLYQGPKSLYPLRDIAVVENVAYVAQAGLGLRIIDVSTPSHPEERGSCDIKGHVMGVAREGNYACITGGPMEPFSGRIDGGLYIFDVSDLSKPKRIGFCDTPGSSYSVAMAGSYAYVADGVRGGLRIIDISNPAHPKERGHFDTRGEALRVAINGNYACVVDGLLGVSIIDVSDPESPKEMAYLDIPGHTEAVAVAGDYIYVASHGGGFFVYKLQAQGASD